jgi:glycosyltransferase involved in cell wall biosynthesis
MAQLLAEAGETVHVIAQRWDGAPKAVEETMGGHLVVHRVPLREPVVPEAGERARLHALAESDCPYQVFAWQAARLAESLIEREGIDVVEGQEWEAPLYFLQRRRAEGQGPKRQPPVLVTLHSPSEFIFRHNEWDVTLTDFTPLKQLEAYTIAAADWLMCPSHYLAAQAARHFRLATTSIDIVPYPIGEPTTIDRPPNGWTTNRICYVGRLELRKGVVELVRAGVALAEEDPTVLFEFVGADTSLTGGPGPTVLPRLLDEIPHRLRGRLRFHGSQPMEAVRKLRQECSAAVVPARWENLPYSCLEAMAAGLPIVVSPAGGMSELIEDGWSGWLAPDETAAGLLVALRRMLATSADERARMGKQASAAVQRICGSRSVVARQLELRRRATAEGATRSARIPHLPEVVGQGWTDERLTQDTRGRAAATRMRRPNQRGRRYSSGAIALGRFQKSFLAWFLSVPLSAKVTAIGHAVKEPSATARWVAWHARLLGHRLRQALSISDAALGGAPSPNRASERQ